MDLQQERQRTKQRASIVAVTSLCAQYILLLMSLPSQRENAQWNEVEVRGLVDHLYNTRSESEGGHFTMEMYDATAKHIASYHSQGPKKTGNMCKTKWISVSYHRRSFTHTN
jgi:hypothetical protein